MKKKVLLFSLIVCFLLCIGCNSENIKEQEKEGNKSAVKKSIDKNNKEEKEIVIGYGIDIEGLNTYNAIETKHNALSLIYDTLLKYENGEIKPNLAEKYTISEDGKSYVLKLREDVLFSDGAKFNADAVVKNFEILRKNEMFAWFGVLSNLESVQATGEYEVKLNYKNPYKPALQELCMYQPLSMVSPKIITEDNIDGMVGTGPYILGDYTKDKSYTFVRNENYFGEKPLYDKVTLKIIIDPDAMIMALNASDIDFVLGSDFITYDAFNQMKNNSKFCCKESQTVLKTKNISLNSNSKFLQNKNLRLAIQYAVNKEEITQGLLYGLEEKADSILHKKLPYCDVEVTKYDFNVEKANEILKNEGWILSEGSEIREKDGEKLVLKMIYPTDFVMNSDMAQAIKGYLRKVGIDVILQGNEMMTWYADCLGGEFDMCIENTYGLPYDPYNLLMIMLDGSSFSISKQNLESNEELDKNIMTALYSNAEVAIKNAFKEVLTKVSEEAIYLPISYQKDLVIFNKDKFSDYKFAGLTEMVQLSNLK